MRFAGDRLVGAGIGGGFDTSNLAGKMGMPVGGPIASITISPNTTGGFTRVDKNDGKNTINYAPNPERPWVNTQIGTGNRDVAYPEGEGAGVRLDNAREYLTTTHREDGEVVPSVRDQYSRPPLDLSPTYEQDLENYRNEKRRGSFLKGANVYDQSAEDFASDLGKYDADIDGSVLERIQAMRGR